MTTYDDPQVARSAPLRGQRGIRISVGAALKWQYRAWGMRPMTEAESDAWASGSPEAARAVKEACAGERPPIDFTPEP